EFLNNRDGEIIGELTKKMEEASKKLDFEKAAKYRDAICAIQETKKMRALNQDPARAPRAEAANAARLLGEVLNFGGEIRAMECFDISHIAGSFTVASMVHFDRGLPAKNKYRRFRLSTHNNDYASMLEAVSRRYKRLFDERKPMPDLVVIDGGKGQVKSALDAFDLHKIPRPLIIGLAKREETVVCSDKTEIKLPRDNEALKLLQRIRDEAHRFANSYRETLQRKKIKESVLDDFDGLGPKKKEALLKRFGSISKIKKATAEELAQADGIGPKTARALREFLDRIARENSAYDCD
ncbi:MAG: UvrB/UvrC motif-containing protein, partial [Opitutales bacterium]|nr:UvrB/UvrC motif-containing protein [Opitutales bacterium]